jgi:hypothetical protein
MKIPGFTAESSVYRTGIQYRMTPRFATNSTIMRPQACNVDCYTDCLDDCRRDIGQPKLQCIRNCRIRCDCDHRHLLLLRDLLLSTAAPTRAQRGKRAAPSAAVAQVNTAVKAMT